MFEFLCCRYTLHNTVDEYYSDFFDIFKTFFFSILDLY